MSILIVIELYIYIYITFMSCCPYQLILFETIVAQSCLLNEKRFVQARKKEQGQL